MYVLWNSSVSPHSPAESQLLGRLYISGLVFRYTERLDALSQDDEGLDALLMHSKHSRGI